MTFEGHQAIDNDCVLSVFGAAELAVFQNSQLIAVETIVETICYGVRFDSDFFIKQVPASSQIEFSNVKNQFLNFYLILQVPVC